jgi:hypothetical protein
MWLEIRNDVYIDTECIEAVDFEKGNIFIKGGGDGYYAFTRDEADRIRVFMGLEKATENDV